VILIPSKVSDLMNVLIGEISQVSNSPVTVFNKQRIEFLAELSRRLLADKDARTMPDIVSFAYWSRRANLTRLADEFGGDKVLRVGLGLSFHICPANVPINFAFSMAFGLLSGNTCVVRLPSKRSPTSDLLIEVIRKLISEEPYSSMADELMLIRFNHSDEVNRFWMSAADGRVIWGGDATIDYMRSMPSRARSREVSFSDRYSITAVNPSAVLALDDNNLEALCLRLFNDIYLMDQAACSSPQLLVWVGDERDVERAKARLWPQIENLANSRYNPQAIQIMDKFVQACKYVVNNDQVIDVKQHGNKLCRIELSDVLECQDQFRGYFGTIHEVTFPTLEPLASVINESYQTITYFGLDLIELKNFIVDYKLRGVDRVVPIGNALDMDLVWDGYEIVSALSRRINLQG
jgi:hypothetical protein